MDIIVGIADMKASADENTQLVTHSLGSCIGLAIYDPLVKVGGLLHYMLPSTTDAAKTKSKPYMFATSGIPLLFRACYKLGAKKNRIIVKAAGGASLQASIDRFMVGKRNYTELKEILTSNNIEIAAEDVGGSVSRTMRFSLATGDVSLKMSNAAFKML